MESCNQGGNIGSQPVFGGECDSCRYLQNIENYLRDLSQSFASFISAASKTMGSDARGIDIVNNARRVSKAASDASDNLGVPNMSRAIYDRMDMLRKASSNQYFMSNAASDVRRSMRDYTPYDKSAYHEKSLRFFEENYLGSKDNAYKSITERLKSVSATTANNLANRMVSLGSALPGISENLFGMLSGKTNQSTWMTSLLSSASVASSRTAHGLATGTYNAEIKEILKTYPESIADASMELKKFVMELNTSASKIERGSNAILLGIGKGAAGVAVAGAGAYLAYQTSLSLAPVQSGASGLERSTSAYVGAASGIGNAISAAGAGMMMSGVGFVPGLITAGVGQGISIGGGYLASKLGDHYNTGSALSTLGMGKMMSGSDVGNEIQAFASNYFAAQASSSAGRSLTAFNYHSGRQGALSNRFGTFAMSDAEREAFYSSILQANRTSGINTTDLRNDIHRLGVSGGTYASAMSAMMYSPSVIGSQRNLQTLTNETISLNRMSPLLGSEFVGYHNAGFLGKASLDAYSQAFFGKGYGDILEGVSKGQITKGSLKAQLAKSGMGLDILKDISPDLYNLVAGTPTDKAQNLDKEQLELMKEQVNYTKEIAEYLKPVAKSVKYDKHTAFVAAHDPGMIRSRGVNP